MLALSYGNKWSPAGGSNDARLKLRGRSLSESFDAGEGGMHHYSLPSSVLV